MGDRPPPKAVLAGSAAFLTALQNALANRLGAPPSAADSPHLAFALCQDDARLLVFEYGGQEWLAACEDLRQVVGDGLGMVAALSPRHGAARGALLGAGVDEVVAWEGRAEPVLAAVGRVLAPAGEAAPVPPAPRPAPAAVTPKPSARAAPAPRAASAPRPGPALTPAPKPAPRTAPAQPPPLAAAARVAPAVTPPPASAAPALTPPSAPRVATAPAFRAARLAPVPPARGSPAPAPPPVPRPSAAPAHPIARPAGPAASAPVLAQTDDEPNFSIVEAPPPDVSAQWGDAELVAFERSTTWPGTVLSSADAEGALAGALSGFWPDREELRAQAERAIASLSDLERRALLLAEVPVAPAVLCRAAGLRFQVQQALAMAPEVEGPVDGAAMRAILAEIDAVLAELKRLEGEAPPEAREAIGGIRRALVKEAIDFTEAAHRSSPSGTPAAAPPVARSAPVARILFNKAVAPAEVVAPTTPRERAKWIVLATVVLLGAAYHGWRHATRPKPLALPAMAGVPAGMIVAPEGPGGVRLLVSETGKPPDAEKLTQFKLQEELKGAVVKEAGPGAILVLPPGPVRSSAESRPAGGKP